ncbi:MAG: cation transporting ATPase C-terminal domain-containing protein, partial [Minisyncoccia bacterium]
CRFEYKSIFKDLFSNKYLILSLAAVLILQLLAIYNPFMQKILGTTFLSFNDWILAIVIAFSIILAEELRKFLTHLKNN